MQPQTRPPGATTNTPSLLTVALTSTLDPRITLMRVTWSKWLAGLYYY